MGLYYIAGVVEPVERGCIVDVCDALNEWYWRFWDRMILLRLRSL